jgi:hypothetical protein
MTGSKKHQPGANPFLLDSFWQIQTSDTKLPWDAIVALFFEEVFRFLDLLNFILLYGFCVPCVAFKITMWLIFLPVKFLEAGII